jgi:glycosyltransferase involved in cell wall biosynthesis
MRVWCPVPGPAASGVARHALDVAELLRGAGVEVVVTRDLARPAGPVDVTCVPFADAVFGADIGSAADALVAWAATAPRPLVVVLHDVPGADEDPDRDARRLAGYRRVVAAADSVVVCSQREAVDLRSGTGVEPVLLPLPVVPPPPPGPVPGWVDRPSVGVLGFVYPGKGHDEALSVVAALGGGARVVALGGVSPGHGALLDGLRARAASLGVELVVTGSLSAADLHAAALATTVPFAAYRTLGASGSLVSWLACGRRPVVASGPQAAELSARWPGSLHVAERAELPAVVGAALAGRLATWRATPLPADRTGAALAGILEAARDRTTSGAVR